MLKLKPSQIFLMLVCAATLTMGGCAKKQKSEESIVPNTVSSDDGTNALGDSDSGKAMGLQTIHFPFDSFVLDSTAKDTLNHNAQLLKDKGGVKIQIEGHCDQRGGIQYNLALGEKRANAVKNYLLDKGVNNSRITTISYGKERPIDSGTSEEAYGKNRRANFVITTK